MKPALFIYLPCGNRAYFDQSVGAAYRCEKCQQFVASKDTPVECQALTEQYDMIERLGGFGWDYINGRQETEK